MPESKGPSVAVAGHRSGLRIGRDDVARRLLEEKPFWPGLEALSCRVEIIVVLRGGSIDVLASTVPARR
jgi:hypothetical protein